MSRLRWPDSTNSVSEKPGTIHWSCCMTPWVVRAGSLTGRVRRALFLECCLQRSQTAVGPQSIATT